MIQLCILVIIAVIVLLLIYSRREPFDVHDKSLGEKALKELESLLASDQVPHISDADFVKIKDKIVIIKEPIERENFFQTGTHDKSYLPYYYYSYPYQYPLNYVYPTEWSRMYNWSPGIFSGTGWTYYLRPGVGRSYVPTMRWVRNNGSYYYITN